MSHTPHELHEEFPEAVDKLHALKLSDHHFARLSERYHEINREIHRIETNVEPASDDPRRPQEAAPASEGRDRRDDRCVSIPRRRVLALRQVRPYP